jgi:glycerol-3-phosphate dehydrogenase
MDRTALWGRLSEPFDLLIIGGGVTGAGAARDAASRGLDVALVEQGDLASGTSSRSSKLVHGGLRYLENGEFNLVFEAVTERRILQHIAPHLVNPQGFLFPVYPRSKHSPFVVNVGMWLYDGLSLFRSPRMHRNLTRDEALEEEPRLRREGLRGAPLYFDCATDDARLTLETAIDASRRGASIATYCKVVSIAHDEQGRVMGARVRDVLSGKEQLVRAAIVINATGPWSDRTRGLGTDPISPRLRPTKGVHIVVDHARLPVQNAVVSFHPKDGRLLFSIPWGDRTYIGTTDTDYRADPGAVQATTEDVLYLLEAANGAFDGVALGPDDVIATWAGVRPLIGEEGAVAESSVSREHDIRIGENGLITISGGKLTTYRRMARELIDQALGMMLVLGTAPREIKESKTDKEPLPGGVGWPEDDDHDAMGKKIVDAAKGAIDAAVGRHLADTYGTRGMEIARHIAADRSLGARIVSDRNDVLAQIDFAIDEEMATTLADVLMRRTQIFLKDRDQGLGCYDAVARRMAAKLGWDEARTTQELASYEAEVGRSRAWREALKVPAEKLTASQSS